MKTILTLGGTGYLGKKVVDLLLTHHHTIISIVRDANKIHNPQIDYYDNSNQSISTVFKEYQIDMVLNMACSYDHGISLYQDVIESNINFPLRVMNAAAQASVKDFVTIGTGLPDNFNMYSVSKKCFSDFGKFYCEKHGLNFVNIKLEMFYGTDEPKDRFIAYVADKLVNNQDIDLTLGYQKRDIIHVNDVSRVVVEIAERQWDGYSEIPVGTGEAPTIQEIVTYMKELLGSKSKLNWGAVPMRRGIEPHCIANTEILTNQHIYIQYNWKDGLKKMLYELMEGR